MRQGRKGEGRSPPSYKQENGSRPCMYTCMWLLFHRQLMALYAGYGTPEVGDWMGLVLFRVQD